ncbi:MAG: hypothetical protein ABEJ89_06735 [Haloarculaceae archaeon]
MAERTSQRSGDRETAVDLDETDLEAGDADGTALDVEGDADLGPADLGVDPGADETARETTRATASGKGGLRDRAREGVSSLAVTLVAALLGVFVVGNAIPLLPFDGFVGIFLTLLVVGAVSARRRYLASALAGGIAGALGMFLSAITLTVLTGGLPVVVGAVVGAAAGVAGHYAGRDLRDGLTRDL